MTPYDAGGNSGTAKAAYVIDVESRPGVADRVLREVLLGLIGSSTGSAGSYMLVVRRRHTGDEVGHLRAGTDYATAVAFCDVVRQRADELSPDDFLATYPLDPAAPWRPAPTHPKTWTDDERRRLVLTLLPVYALLVVVAIAVTWAMR